MVRVGSFGKIGFNMGKSLGGFEKNVWMEFGLIRRCDWGVRLKGKRREFEWEGLNRMDFEREISVRDLNGEFCWKGLNGIWFDWGRFWKRDFKDFWLELFGLYI